MENRITRNRRRMPLPGVAGAPSGANAGGDSYQRAVGGQELAGALTGLPEQNTTHNITTNLPVQGVLDTDVVPTTNTGLIRQRIKWTAAMNKAVMRAYYIATRMETNMTAYRCEMKRIFVTECPQLQRLSEQNVSDRRRAIVHRRLLTEVEIHNTKMEAQCALRSMGLINTQDGNEGEINENNSEMEQQDQNSMEVMEMQNARPEPNTEEDGRVEEALNDAEVEQLRIAFRAAMLEFEDVEPLSRHTIPRLYPIGKVYKYIGIINRRILPQHLSMNITLERLSCLIYISAVSVTRVMGFNTTPPGAQEHRARPRVPFWERRLIRKVENLRKDMGRLTEYKNGIRSRKLTKCIARIVLPRAINDISVQDILEIMDLKRQSLAASAKRLARYRESRDRKIQNAQFVRNERTFYRKLEGVEHESDGCPEMTEMEDYWSALWGRRKDFNENAFILQNEKMDNMDLPQMEPLMITAGDVETAVTGMANWKATGPDRLHNIWLKKFTCTHFHMARCFNQLIHNPNQTPEFMTIGNTYLLPKQKDAKQPNQFRPITCLSNIYKLLTKIITNRIYTHCEVNNIFTNEQKGCMKNTQGCKDQLTIDSVVVQQAIRKCKNLSMAYIDYCKAFDSMPHDYLIHVLKIYKVDANIIKLIQHLMSEWNIRLCMTGCVSGPIIIRNGILQGDAFSPLWFCLGLNPLSKQLRRMKAELGFKLKHTEGQTYLNHLMYIDDIKLYASNKEKLHRMIGIVDEFSQSIGMSFGLEKCKTAHLKRGKVVNDQEGCAISDEKIMESLNVGENYKYLGFAQLRGLDTKRIKTNIEKVFNMRMQKILKSKLSAGNKCKAINTWAIPVYNYSFGVVKWSDTDIDNIARNIRVLLTKYQSHHPRSAIERVVLPRGIGGSGILDIAELQDRQICSLREYFLGSDNCEILNAIIKSDENYTPLNLNSNQHITPANVKGKNDLLDSWKQKQLHGKHPKEMFNEQIDVQNSNLWLKKGKLIFETEAFLMAIQDGVIATRNYRKHILSENISTDKCRRCNTTTETIDHIISGCPMLSSTDYLERHNKVAKIIHRRLAKANHMIETDEPYYKYNPPPVTENNNIILYWDRQVITDRAVAANKPDILLMDKENKYIYIIDVSIPLTENLQKAYSNKIAKYTDLAIELEKMYHITRIKIIPIVISATGVVPNNLVTNLKILEMEGDLEDIQKAVILSTCHIVRKFTR